MSEVAAGRPLLSAFGVSFGYDPRFPVLREISLELERGEVLALLGPNGSGKTTLLKALAGIHPLRGKGRHGQIRYRGQNLAEMSLDARARRVSYVGPEFTSEFPMSAWEAVLLGRLCHDGGARRRVSQTDRDRIHWAMELCGCWHLRERMVSTLSGGERQLVALARALTQEARCLLLDEALSKMDLHHQARVGGLLGRLASDGYGVILVAHDVNLAAEFADSCILMKNGGLVASGPMERVLHRENLSLLYPGAELSVGKNPVSGKPWVLFARSTS